jgi:hypothetical protein
MEHCSYRHSDFYYLITLLMSSIESHLSYKPKQVFFNPYKYILTYHTLLHYYTFLIHFLSFNVNFLIYSVCLPPEYLVHL